MDVAWSPHDAWLASCSVDNTVVIWNAVKFPGENFYVSNVQYVKLCGKLFAPWALFTDCENQQVGMGCLSFEMTFLQSGDPVLLPSLDGSEQWMPLCCRQQPHSGF